MSGLTDTTIVVMAGDERIMDILATKQIEANVFEMNKNEMHEVDQLVMTVDTQRSIIRILQKKLACQRTEQMI